jgi:hypothetical protein
MTHCRSLNLLGSGDKEMFAFREWPMTDCQTDRESYNNVPYMLKARTVDPQKQPMLAYGSQTTYVSR